MKRIVSTILGLAILAIAGAAHAVPSTVELTGRLSNQNGMPVTGTVTLTFTLFAAPSGGGPVWSEVRPNLPASSAGLVFVDLGAVTPFTATAFDGGDRWLEINIGGETLTPRLKIHAVPYALRAADADTVGGLDPADLGDVTGVTAGLGLTGGAASGEASLAVNTAVIQRRVAGTCPSGIATISATGTVDCAASPFSSCTWERDSSSSSTSTSQDVLCPPGKHAVSGGCDAAGTTTVRFTRPFGPPAGGVPAANVSGWNCQFSSAASGHVAYALCCAF